VASVWFLSHTAPIVGAAGEGRQRGRTRRVLPEPAGKRVSVSLDTTHTACVGQYKTHNRTFVLCKVPQVLFGYEVGIGTSCSVHIASFVRY
jgi:hypothetical protein